MRPEVFSFKVSQNRLTKKFFYVVPKKFWLIRVFKTLTEVVEDFTKNHKQFHVNLAMMIFGDDFHGVEFIVYKQPGINPFFTRFWVSGRLVVAGLEKITPAGFAKEENE